MNPASASPSSSLVTMSVTLASWLTMFSDDGLMPRLSSTVSVYAPIGTLGSPTTSLALPMLLTEVIPAGLSAGVASTSVLVAKLVVLPSRFWLCTCSGYLVLAAAKTSAGSPCSICAASWSDPRNSNSSFQAGGCSREVVAIFGRASNSDEAANTTSLPPDGADEPPLYEPEPLPLPQPAATSSAGTTSSSRD